MSIKRQAWWLFDRLVRDAESRATSPWSHTNSSPFFAPDFGTLRNLLGVPLLLGAPSQSGVPALAIDVWMSYEFRRAGFDRDAVWPRPEAPRVLPAEIRRLLGALTGDLSKALTAKIESGTNLGGAVGADANILGKNYVKQVDVGMSGWNTGPELLVSTKRMDSSFAKNAANRIEESYGDAKNLRLRHPQAALGFVYGLRSTALRGRDREKAIWLIDLLSKLGHEDDAYHAVALLLPDWDDQFANGLLRPDVQDVASDDTVSTVLGAMRPEDAIGALPSVDLNIDSVPPDLQPSRFFELMTRRVLANSPVRFHREARERLADSPSVIET